MNRKRIIAALAVIILAGTGAQAQSVLERMAERAKNAAENAVGNKIENAINNAVDNVGKKKGRNDSKSTETKGNTTAEDAGVSVSVPTAEAWTCPECGKTGNTGAFCDDCGAKKPAAGAPAVAAQPVQQAAPAPVKPVESEYAKSDFVPGDEIFFEDTMEGEQMGEFPSKWDLLEGEAETAKIGGKTCISLTAAKTTTIEPLMKNQKSYLPDVFTLEFDFYRGKTDSSMGYIVSTTSDTERGYAFDIEISGQHSTELGGNVGYYTPSGDNRNADLSYILEGDTWNHFALSFNKRALKVYINGKRVANIPNCEKPNRFNIQQYSWGGFDDSGTNAITNVRLAKGAVPLYDRLTTDGKIITYAITFETGKADLKPESMVEINRIANLMKENANLSFEVQGHCDATGSDKVNDPLSQKRAEAIVAALVEQGIASARLSAVGKGSHVPIADNSSDEGRAKNRRVEFVKK